VWKGVLNNLVFKRYGLKDGSDVRTVRMVQMFGQSDGSTYAEASVDRSDVQPTLLPSLKLRRLKKALVDGSKSLKSGVRHAVLLPFSNS
jgi:hypothetical protein